MESWLEEVYDFNSRPHEEVDIKQKDIVEKSGLFQLTTSRGGRRYTILRNNKVKVFQLTTSRGGRPHLLGGME